MTRHIFIALALVVVVSIGSLTWRFMADKSKADAWNAASDAGQVTRTYQLGLDSWIGYAPLCGDMMARKLAAQGIGLKCHDDAANMAERFAALRRGDLDLAVTTVDAYLRDYTSKGPIGPIVAVIDESAGGDAIVARKSVASELTKLSTVSAAPRRVAFTPASPSEYLMTAVGQHFGIPFTDSSRFTLMQTDGSGKALTALQKGKADIAVLWEPDVSAALRDPDFVKLLGSEDTAGLIVDTLAASPAMVSKHEADLRIILQAFFETLDFYDNDAGRRDSDLAARLGVKQKDVEALVGGVRWAHLSDNGLLWFNNGPDGYGEKRLLSTLHSTQDILYRAGAVGGARLDAQVAMAMIWSQTIESLHAGPGATANSVTNTQFPALSDEEWRGLKEIGALKVDAITFQPGTFLLTESSRADLDRVSEILDHYPKYRLVVRGHTADVGDQQANLELSARRAQAVTEYLTLAHPIDSNRVRAEGYGGSQPPAREANESDRAWRYRQARVELSFVGKSR